MRKKQNTSSDNLLNKKQSAEYLGISVITLTKMIRDGVIQKPRKISAVRVGYHINELNNFIDKR